MNRMKSLDLPMAVSAESQVIPVAQEALSAVADRMGKITQALVMVATVAPDTYGLFSRNVDYAVTLLSHVYNIESLPHMATREDVSRITIGIRQMGQQWTLCHTAGLVSDMNYQVIMRELQSLQQYIQEKLMTYCIGQVTYPFRIPDHVKGGYQPEQFSLDQFFAPGDVPKKSVPTPVGESSQRHQPVESVQKSEPNKSVSDISRTPKIESFIQKREPEKVTPKITETLPLKTVPIIPQSGEDKKERRDAIMRTIRSKGQVTIKDISEHVTGVSEKTIQRDLQELIQHGVLIREGEKRWAVYKLAMSHA